MLNQEIKDAWKRKASERSITSNDVVAYSIIKALQSKRNDKYVVAKAILYSSFTPITNANGAQPFMVLKASIANISMRYSTMRYSNKVKFFGSDLLTPDELISFGKIIKELREEKHSDTIYTHILVRQDISREQQLVQSSHVAMVLGQVIHQTKHNAKCLHFLVYGVPTNLDLLAISERLSSKRVKFESFLEEDMNNVLTAIACHPMRKSVAIRKRLFEGCELLTLTNENSISIAK